jgi:hypothetical protein
MHHGALREVLIVLGLLIALGLLLAIIPAAR